MTPRTALLMAEYNRWMNLRLYEASGRLSPPELVRDRGAFFGSLFETLNHLAAADTIWLHRFAEHPEGSSLGSALAAFPRPTSLRQSMAPDLEALLRYRTALDEVILDWARSLTSAHLDAPLAYRNMAGESHARNFGSLVQHYFNHQTHHRGQATTLLFQAGVDVGVTDLLAVIPEER